MPQQQTVFRCHGLVVELDPSGDDDDGSMSIPTRDAITAPDAVAGINGRTFHGYHEGAYHLPNDGTEQDRLDFQHEIVLLLLDGRLGLAPVTSPRHVLDVATGTGIWAIQYAEQNPGSNVVGTDLSVIQRECPVPNCSFVQHDMEADDWPFEHNFDYIYLRFIVACFDDTKSVIQRVFDHLNPGGYMEIFDLVFTRIDFDGSMEGTAYDRWMQLLHKGSKRVGRDLDRTKQYPAWCRDAGFVDVEEKRFPLPCGTWAKDPKLKKAGRYSMHNQLALVGGALTKFLEFAGLSRGEIEELVERARQDLRDPDRHFAMDYRVTYGRKPA